ncbi:hypothetical protein GCM10010289_24710 [Streptomyces violascens]|uniref:Uncharacterized protein n=1 Tax=Streptomyces violascens TaxID=67381 RepID=A0ABQ3QIE8_9ACTN|nr:hypothetical protein GCM10010289_24710 [Streptomyces violascens]GHI37002.1 hypothetical protein Sviol_14100 [Streptomyces violascens]
MGQAVVVPPVPGPGLQQPIPAPSKAGIGCLTSESACPAKTEAAPARGRQDTTEIRQDLLRRTDPTGNIN